jgi:LysM repeat protein
MPEKQNSLTFLATCLIGIAILLAGCAVPPSNSTQPRAVTATPRSGELAPYIYPSTTPTRPVSTPPTLTPLPTPSPTPRTHVVKKGEDMGGIAYLYKITLQELLAANPKIQPNQMSVGTMLIIPGGKADSANETKTANINATVVPLKISPVFCTPTQDGGVWCSLLLHNTQDYPLEGVAASIHLVGTQTQANLTQTAFLPLDLLQPGQSLPVTTYFPPPTPTAFQASAEIISALPSPNDGRYLLMQISQQKVFLSENGLSAQITLQVALKQEDIPAKRIWVAATAYDAQGKVVGVRRWEKPDSQPLEPGKSLAMRLNVFSSAGPIQRVELAAEARP